MNRRNAVAALGLALTMTVTGCSAMGGAEDGTVTLQMVESLTNPARTQVLKRLLTDFEKQNPKIKVNLISPPTSQADQKMQQMLQSGSGVDTLEVRDITVGSWSNNGWLYDMSTDLKGWSGWQELTENAVKAGADAKGRTYFVPYGFYGLSLFYRKDLVGEAGYDKPPGTWEELVDQASAIQDKSKRRYGYAFRGGPNAGSNVTAIIEAYAADRIDPADGYRLTDGSTVFSAPEANEALTKYLELFEKGSPPSSIAWGYPEMVEGFANGSTAFLLQDPEVIATLRESKAIDEEQWTTAPLLAGPGGKAVQPLATAGWGVAKGSKHKAEAVKLVEFLSEGEASTTFAKKNSLVPILKQAGEDPFYRTGPWASYLTMNQAPETYLNVTQPRDVPWFTEWTQKADADVQKVLLGKMTPKQLLTDWDAYWTAKRKNEKS
ncbi:MAG TPA: ABC transporter substrate-binding protein [Streptomyces sp.]|uniref:Sugar ABC transporter substrate-binding protein n=1 Tax=Streptomyces salyersiae TaxID=3075530 RepID=A0ABU2RQ54_9ACTN|nr:sugar ABC transporter substrate-binding protein [Streptomyces sp. DSM 41770]MDT0430652.1 sugar ABC transporter substrate-binding protein [Streptomyces sp. DSM 41770]HBF80605.1 ABC transporter substrate-binding protein [Streptomyces sp.]